MQLLGGESSATPVDVEGATPTLFTATNAGTLNLPYFAQYYQTGTPVGAGPVTATVNYTIAYP